jgi:hypothetical protein
MTNQRTSRTSLDGGLALDQEMNRQRVDLETAAKFRFFFVGLVFAILSFAIQFPIKTFEFGLKLSEATSWGLIAITGLFALVDIGGFSLSSESNKRLTTYARVAMWVCFFTGVVLLLASKIWASFYG